MEAQRSAILGLAKRTDSGVEPIHHLRDGFDHVGRFGAFEPQRRSFDENDWIGGVYKRDLDLFAVKVDDVDCIACGQECWGDRTARVNEIERDACPA